MIIAGAGIGSTTTLLGRISYLVRISRVRRPLVLISAKNVNLQQNLCNKPRGSGEEEISDFSGFESHWSRFQRKAPICSKTYVINRVVPERRKLLEPNRRILYYWRRPEGFFTRILYYWRRTEGFFTIGAEQKDS